MRLSVADVLARLKAEGRATDAVDAPARAALQTELDEHLPWYLGAAVGLGAWLATGFFLGFLVYFVDIDDAFGRIVLGIALVGVAVWQRRRAGSGFLRHASVAIALAGLGLIIVGLDDWVDTRAAAVVVMLLSATLIVLMPDSVFRFLATLVALAACYVAVAGRGSTWGYEVVTIVVVALVAVTWRFRIRDREPRMEEMLRPVGYAVVLGLFVALLVGSSTQLGRLSFEPGRWLIVGRMTTIGVTVVLLALVWLIIDEQGGATDSPSSIAALLGVVALGATTLTTPGIIAGAGVLTLAFDRRDKVLLGMAVAYLLVFGTVFYYSLHLTLLEKSGVLAGSGALLLTLRQRLKRA